MTILAIVFGLAFIAAATLLVNELAAHRDTNRRLTETRNALAEAAEQLQAARDRLAAKGGDGDEPPPPPRPVYLPPRSHHIRHVRRVTPLSTPPPDSDLTALMDTIREDQP